VMPLHNPKQSSVVLSVSSVSLSQVKTNYIKLFIKQ
jgi:hypothetical protein